MTIETAERLAIAAEQAMFQVGGGPEGIAEFRAFVEGLLKALDRFHSRENIYNALLGFEEPSPKTVSLIEASLKYSPRLLSWWFRAKRKGFLNLQEGPTGRPNSISPEQCYQVCNEISAWERKGRSLSDAKKAVAKLHQVNPRTIHRIWLRRSEFPTGGVSIQEAHTFVTTIFETPGENL